MPNEKKISRWKPGESGNPKGRTPGQSPITKMRESLADDMPEILAVMVRQAKDGDVGAARILIDRVFPVLRPTEQAVALRLPANGTLTAKAHAVLSAAAAGTLSPGQASQLITALGAMAKIIETDELAERIAALEGAQHHGNA